MHPFCCITTVSEQNSGKPSHSLPEFHMSPLPPAVGGGGIRSDSGNRSINLNHNHGNNSIDHGRLTESMSRTPSICGDQREVKINDIVGNGISGILYKWVNYGKGWRPRWFVLQDGVLSYYKIHGPDKIIVNQETEKGSKVIGEESFRRINRHKNGSSQLRRKPVGEVHLKVRFKFLFQLLLHFPFLFHYTVFIIITVLLCMHVCMSRLNHNLVQFFIYLLAISYSEYRARMG